MNIRNTSKATSPKEIKTNKTLLLIELCPPKIYTLKPDL